MTTPPKPPPPRPPQPPPRFEVIDFARRYVAAGLSIIPIKADGSKAPALKAGQVEQYRERFPTEEELALWYAPNKANGIAVVCGKQSGNLAVFDLESNDVWLKWSARVVEAGHGQWLATAPIVKTPKGGRHVYFRITETWMAGMVLARLNAKHPLIEIRGQGHYVLAPGSPSACHERNIDYVFESKGWLDNAFQRHD